MWSTILRRAAITDDMSEATFESRQHLRILRGGDTPAIELNRARIDAEVTPESDLFVCQHNPVPDPSPLDTWALRVCGVARPREVAGAELHRLGDTSITAVLQCAGNGRAFSRHTMMDDRTPNWQVGALANIRWTGVPLVALTQLVGNPDPGARYLTATGGDPLPTNQPVEDVVVERSVPIDKALRDGILAWAMNGRGLAVLHGGPLRLVIPGYFGVNSVKWVTRLEFSRDQSDARMQKSKYRLRPIGHNGSPAYPSTWKMPVKSLITSVGTRAHNGSDRSVARGVAFSGNGGIRAVEISIDDGRSWFPADLGAQASPFAWRRFSATLPDDCAERVASRATDASGMAQPRDRIENERGYANNSWKDHAFVCHPAS